MSTLGTFDGFNAMRLGIYAAQQGLRVTGNNISNINTVGYTRQRADQVSFRTGGSDRYSSMIDKKVGNGVLISGINQIRDPFLDIRYRNASNDTYHLDTWLAGMQDIHTILDEVGKGENDGDGLIYAQLQDLAEKLRAYSANPTIENDRLVRESANALTGLFRYTAGNLDQLYEDTKVDFNNSITTVNEILTNIRDLDKSIREAEIHGDMALELRDERNLQIDKLSQYLDIKVEYSYENVGSGIQVEKLTIKLNNANPDKNVTTDESILVDGLYATQLSVPELKPLANTFDTTEYAYLKGYSYLKGLTADEAAALTNEEIEALGLDPTQDILTQLASKTVDGVTTYYVGTNSVDEADKVTNDNYTIQLDKLLNSKGEEWEKSTTTWLPVEGVQVPYNRWAATITSNLKVGDRFTVAGTTYTVVADTYAGDDPNITPVKLSQVESSKALAKFAAEQLEASDTLYTDYTVTSEGNQIIFTAKTSGFNVAPTLNDVPENNPLIDVDDEIKVLDPEIKVDPPADIDLNQYPKETYDEYGNKTTVNYVQVGDQWYKVTIKTEYAREIALDDNDTHGIIQAQRELLTEEGEFASQDDVDIDENALTKRGIPYYQKSLDLLAQKIAEEYNKLNQGYAYNQDGYYIDKNGNPLMLDDISSNPATPMPVSVDGLTEGQAQNLINNGFFTEIVNEDGTTTKVADLNKWLANNKDAYAMGGVLFSNGNNGDATTDPAINARNIDISYGWSNGKWNLVPTFKMLFTDDGGLAHSTQNDNADHMLAMIDKGLVYNPKDLAGSDAIGPVLFSGSFNDMLSHMMAVEAGDARVTNIKLNTSANILEELDFAREGISGVDLNDEAMNMVQYQKAMNAAMRLMTAIDESLERLINNTGVAGR